MKEQEDLHQRIGRSVGEGGGKAAGPTAEAWRTVGCAGAPPTLQISGRFGLRHWKCGGVRSAWRGDRWVALALHSPYMFISHKPLLSSHQASFAFRCAEAGAR